MQPHPWGVLCLSVVVLIPGCARDEISSPGRDTLSETASVVSLGKANSPSGSIVPYTENFARSAKDWVKVGGPGLLEVVGGVYQHTTPGYSVWCEYAYATTTFGNAAYELDVFVDNATLATSFVWRAPDLQVVTATGGAYLATFNNSGLAPGPAGHFTVERLDPLGRTMLLDIPNQFLGLNRLLIEDRGNSLTVSINGVAYGTFDVTGLSAPHSGYIVLIGGDRAAGDYFDNIRIRRLQ